MHEEYKRALQWVINHCTNEATAIYCSSDCMLSNTQYARIAAYEDDSQIGNGGTETWGDQRRL